MVNILNTAADEWARAVTAKDVTKLGLKFNVVWQYYVLQTGEIVDYALTLKLTPWEFQ